MSVCFPEMRARLRRAVDALSDPELHRRLWLYGDRRSPSELGFDDTLLVLVDEMERFGPSDLVGDVLRDDQELVAFNDLTAAVEALIDAIGKSGDFADALATGTTWESCQVKARQLAPLLGRSDA